MNTALTLDTEIYELKTKANSPCEEGAAKIVDKLSVSCSTRLPVSRACCRCTLQHHRVRFIRMRERCM